MKIYVAGKNLTRAQKVMGALRDHNHEIVFDWTVNYDEKKEELAQFELNGVRGADTLVYLWESDQESARYEAGMAMGLGKKIVISGDHDSFFFNLPNVTRVNSDEEIVEALSINK